MPWHLEARYCTASVALKTLAWQAASRRNGTHSGALERAALAGGLHTWAFRHARVGSHGTSLARAGGQFKA